MRAHARAPVAESNPNRLSNFSPNMKRKLYVLIACEESQAECKAFRELGHIAYSCDIQQCKKGSYPEFHINADVTPLLNGRKHFNTQDGKKHRVPRWDLIIAHPPCTYLCKVSSYWIHHTAKGVAGLNEERLKKMQEAREFFMQCLQAKAPYVAVENPMPMRRAKLPTASCYLQPSWFGVKYTKKTLYWLKNLPPILPEIIHPSPKSFVKASRGKYRSRTFPQVAKAIAKQWSEYILNDR